MSMNEWIASLKENDYVDSYNSSSKQWLIAKVTEVYPEYKLIRFDINYEKWTRFNKVIDQIAKFNTHTIPIILSKLDLNLKDYLKDNRIYFQFLTQKMIKII